MVRQVRPPTNLVVLSPEPEEPESQSETESEQQPEDERPLTSKSHISPLQIIQKIHRYSSYTFSGFFFLHASSVLIAPVISTSFGDATLQLTNPIYQSPSIEPLLVYGSLTAHLTAGIILRAHNLYLNKKHYDQWKLPKFSPLAVSGYVVLPFVLAHMITTRIAPHWILRDSSLISLQYVSHGFHKHPVLTWLAYIPLIFLVSHHVIWGWKKWLNLYGKRYSRKTYGLFSTILLCGYFSVIRISRMPDASGWVASQFDKVLAKIYL